MPLIGDWLTGILFAGETVGGATLTRFYATHVFMIPAIIFGALGLHLYLVIRHGVSDPPVPGVVVDKKTYRQRYEERRAPDRRAVLARRRLEGRRLCAGGRLDRAAARDRLRTAGPGHQG